MHSCFCNVQESELTAILPDVKIYEMIDHVPENNVINGIRLD